MIKTVSKSFFLVFLSIFFIFVYSCKQKPADNEALIKGEFTNLSQGKIFLDVLTESGKQICDSASIINGKFKFNIKLNESGIYFIRLSDNNFISLILSPKDNITLKANYEKISYPILFEGSTESIKLIELNHRLDDCYHVTDSLSIIFKEYAETDKFDSIKNVLDSAYYKMFNRHKIRLQNYIKTNSSSLTVLIAFYQNLGKRSFFNENDDYNLLEIIDNGLNKTIPTNSYVINFHKKFAEKKEVVEARKIQAELLIPGNKSPEIEQFDIKANKIILSEIKGKKLLMFWGLWNQESMKDIAIIKNISQKGVSVIAISLDENMELWKKVAQTTIPFATHINQPQVFESNIAKQYNIISLPYYFFIDNDNTIITHSADIASIKKFTNK